MHVQWNLRIKDTLGAELLYYFWRLSSGGRFIQITPYQEIIDGICSCIVCMDPIFLVQEVKELTEIKDIKHSLQYASNGSIEILCFQS